MRRNKIYYINTMNLKPKYPTTVSHSNNYNKISMWFFSKNDVINGRSLYLLTYFKPS